MTPSLADTRVLVVEDHTLLAQSVALALRAEGFDVQCPELTGMSDLTAALVRLRATVALVDLDLGPYLDGTELIAPLVRTGTAVLVVTASHDRVTWGGCLQRGAAAVLGKGEPLDVLVGTVRQAASGLPVWSRAERLALLEQWRVERSELDGLRARFARLTARERQVLGELAGGLSVHDIADRDVVSEATVLTQVKSILAKLEVKSRLTAVTMAHRLGWEPPAPDVRAG
jgi:DNA-binding NarL/FixJ family response regulator